jgi:dihydroanticapsin dehydrogenase
MNAKRFVGKVVIITGGGTGIGKATAHAFAREGANTVIAGINEGDLLAAKKEITERDGICDTFVTDIRKPDEVNDLIERTVQRYSKLDVFFANAGVNIPAPITETKDSDVDYLVDTNVKGTYYQLRKATDIMLKQGFGNMIVMSSMSGLIGHPNNTLYCATKGALSNLVRALALELAQHHIRVNAVCPGTIDTPMFRTLVGSQRDPEKAYDLYAAKEPMKRIGSADEVAHVVLFLASEEASFVTGALYPVDGGYLAGS